MMGTKTKRYTCPYSDCKKPFDVKVEMTSAFLGRFFSSKQQKVHSENEKCPHCKGKVSYNGHNPLSVSK